MRAFIVDDSAAVKLIQDRVNADLLRTASETPSVIIRPDDGGVEARRFGGETSSHQIGKVIHA